MVPVEVIDTVSQRVDIRRHVWSWSSHLNPAGPGAVTEVNGDGPTEVVRDVLLALAWEGYDVVPAWVMP